MKQTLAELTNMMHLVPEKGEEIIQKIHTFKDEITVFTNNAKDKELVLKEEIQKIDSTFDSLKVCINQHKDQLTEMTVAIKQDMEALEKLISGKQSEISEKITSLEGAMDTLGEMLVSNKDTLENGDKEKTESVDHFDGTAVQLTSEINHDTEIFSGTITKFNEMAKGSSESLAGKVTQFNTAVNDINEKDNTLLNQTNQKLVELGEKFSTSLISLNNEQVKPQVDDLTIKTEQLLQGPVEQVFETTLAFLKGESNKAIGELTKKISPIQQAEAKIENLVSEWEGLVEDVKQCCHNAMDRARELVSKAYQKGA